MRRPIQILVNFYPFPNVFFFSGTFIEITQSLFYLSIPWYYCYLMLASFVHHKIIKIIDLIVYFSLNVNVNATKYIIIIDLDNTGFMTMSNFAFIVSIQL